MSIVIMQVTRNFLFNTFGFVQTQFVLLSVSVLLCVFVNQTTALAETDMQEVYRSVEEDLDIVEQQVNTQEQKIKFIQNEFRNARFATSGKRFDERLAEGQTFFVLNDFLHAAIVLFDAVESSENKKNPKYPLGLYYLAESLFQTETYLAARSYFRELIDINYKEHLEDSVHRIVEIALRTGNYQGIDQDVQRMKTVLGDNIRDDIFYEYSKILFHRANNESAYKNVIGSFATIKDTSSYFAKAQYFIGVTYIKLQDFDHAIEAFKNIISISLSDEDSKLVKEQAHLALARLYYETDKIELAVDHYQNIERDSSSFGQMLYEMTWAFIKQASKKSTPQEKANEYKKAIDSLELLMASLPSSELVPESAILQGNLFLRVGKYEQAQEIFEKLEKNYGIVATSLDNVLSQSGQNMVVYKDLVSEEIGKSSTSAKKIHPLAKQWAAGQSDISKTFKLKEYLQLGQQFIDDSRQMISKLGGVVNEKDDSQYGMFPVFTDGRNRALEVENILTSAKQKMNDIELKLIRSETKHNEESQNNLSELQKDRESLQKAFSKVPQTKIGIEERKNSIELKFSDIEKKVYQFRYVLEGQKAQLIALDSYLVENGNKNFSKEEDEKIKGTIVEVNNELAKLEKELNLLVKEVDTERQKVLASSGTQNDKKIRIDFNKALGEEEQQLKNARGSLGNKAYALVQRMDRIRESIKKQEQDLASTYKQLNMVVAEKSKEINETIVTEEQRLKHFQSLSQKIEEETDNLAGVIAYESFVDVKDKIYDVLLRADVGIVDVAWQEKMDTVKKMSTSSDKKNEEVKKLETRYQEILSN